MNITIRPEGNADRTAIRAVVTAAFGRSIEADLVDQLRATGDLRFSLVALQDNRIIGHVAASPIRLDPDPGLSCIGIAPLSVEPALQSKGTGGQLMRAIIIATRQVHADALFLLGNPAYYQRFGFSTASVANSYGATSAFMQLCLVADCLSGIKAHAHYAPAFAESGA